MVFSKKRDRLSFQVKELGAINLTVSVALALVGTIWAIYFESLVHNPSQVGFINTLFGVAGIISFIVFIPLIEKSSKTKLLAFAIGIYLVSYMLFYFIDNLYFAIILGLIIYVSASLRVNVSGIILRDKSRDGQVPKNTGFMYVLLNISWLLGPLLAGFLSQRFGIKFIFIISGLLMFLAFSLLKEFGLKDNRKTKKVENNLFHLIKGFFSKKKFVLSYIVSGGVNFWWAFIYIYVPIYIIESGKSDLIVGYFLSGIIAPLVLLEYLFGKATGKVGFKKMFFRGYLIVLVVSLLCFFINDIYAILILLVLGSVGIAMLEPTTESHFFSIASKDERDKYYGVYNTSIDLNYVISLFLVAMLLRFVEFKYSFILIGVFMGIFALVSLMTKDKIRKKHSKS
jgi:ACDE family multidrug resistance protein